ncbi:hypothetical protein [Wohlfahrtiimonas larvae]|nr:hypothetical protein [Wohlfahrtiimonas larvae]
MNDFERTENSDYIHGVIGRALIIATRFEISCRSYEEIPKVKAYHMASLLDNDPKKFENLIVQMMKKFQSLNTSITNIKGLNGDLTDILHDARESRNYIAHSLTIGLDRCFDLTMPNNIFIDELKEHINKIIDADILISLLIVGSNKDDIPTLDSIAKYKASTMDWIFDE